MAGLGTWARAAAPGLRRSAISAATATLVVGSIVVGAGAGRSPSVPGSSDVSVSGTSTHQTKADLHDQYVPPGVDVPGVTDVKH